MVETGDGGTTKAPRRHTRETLVNKMLHYMYNVFKYQNSRYSKKNSIYFKKTFNHFLKIEILKKEAE